jgi:hypothetical protein
MGGALVLGGVRRLARAPSAGASLATGFGVAVIASSRPFEGLFFVIVPAGIVAWVLFQQLRLKRWRPALVTVGPMLIVIGAAGALMGVYNSRITGSAARPPYLEYERQYAASPALLGQASPARPPYGNAVMEQFYTRGTGFTGKRTNWRALLKWHLDHRKELLGFYAPWFIAPLVFVLPWAARGAWVTIALACMGVTAGAAALTLFALQPHYLAPLAAAWCALLTLGARFTAQLRWRRIRAGRGMVGLVLVCLVLSAVAEVGAALIRRQLRGTSWSWQRQEIERRLAKGGKHLILVEYGPRHDPGMEWVYNRADIDASAVVWARSLGESRDADVRRYFADRTAWRLAVSNDAGPFVLTPLATDIPRQPQRR